jgi:8-oxo-dGTP diphosphatase
MSDTMGGGQGYAVAVIVNARSQILFLQRSPQASLGPNKWGFPGGRLAPGENPETAMIREMFEELGPGIRTQRQAIFGPVPAQGIPGAFVYLFRYRWLGGAVRLNPEHSRFAWVDAATFPSLDVMDGVEADLAYFGLWTR